MHFFARTWMLMLFFSRYLLSDEKKKLLSKFYDAMCLIFDSIEAHAHIKVPYYLISCIRIRHTVHIKNDENISLI